MEGVADYQSASTSCIVSSEHLSVELRVDSTATGSWGHVGNKHIISAKHAGDDLNHQYESNHLILIMLPD